MGAGTDPGSDSGVAGGRDHRVVREGKVSPPLNPGRRPRLPEWVRQAAEADAELPKREHAQAKLLLCRIPCSQSRKEAERLRSIFSTWCHERAHQAASEALERDWERMVTFYHFPREHWQHLRTTNPVESPFAALRLRTDAAKRYKRVDRATAVIWKMLMIAEKRFRRLKALGLMRNVYLGTLYMDGMAIEATVEEVAA